MNFIKKRRLLENKSKEVMRTDKRAMELEMIGWWLIALAVLILAVIAIIIVLKPKGVSAIEYIKNLFKFRGG